MTEHWARTVGEAIVADLYMNQGLGADPQYAAPEYRRRLVVQISSLLDEHANERIAELEKGISNGYQSAARFRDQLNKTENALKAWCALGALVYRPEHFTGISGDRGAVLIANAWRATKEAGFDASAGEHLIEQLRQEAQRAEKGEAERDEAQAFYEGQADRAVELAEALHKTTSERDALKSEYDSSRRASFCQWCGLAIDIDPDNPVDTIQAMRDHSMVCPKDVRVGQLAAMREALEGLKIRIASKGQGDEPVWHDGNGWVPDWREEVAAMNKALATDAGKPVEDQKSQRPG